MAISSLKVSVAVPLVDAPDAPSLCRTGTRLGTPSLCRTGYTAGRTQVTPTRI